MRIQRHPTRRNLLKLAGAASLATVATRPAPALAAADFPSKPIRLIVPLPPGGTADAAARIQALQLEKVLKQPVIVDNKPGGSYVIAMNALASAPADGHTLMAINVSMCSAQATLRKYDMLEQLALVGRASETHAILVVPAKSPFKTVADLVTHAKANPGRLNYAVGGAGSAEHLMTAAMEQAAGHASNMIPFKGAVDGITALVAGDVDYQIVPLPLGAQFTPKGLVRALAVFSPQRLKDLADVPTAAEAGLPVPPFTYWGGIAAPAGTPADVVQQLHRAFNEVSKHPEVQAKFAAIGATTVVSASPAEFTKEIAAELERMNAAVKAGNIKVS